MIAAKLAKREKEKIASRFRVFSLADFESEIAATAADAKELGQIAIGNAPKGADSVSQLAKT